MLASQLEAENLSYYCNMHVFSYDINRVGIAVIKASSSINVMCVTVIIKIIVLMLFQWLRSAQCKSAVSESRNQFQIMK